MTDKEIFEQIISSLESDFRASQLKIVNFFFLSEFSWNNLMCFIHVRKIICQIINTFNWNKTFVTIIKFLFFDAFSLFFLVYYLLNKIQIIWFQGLFVKYGPEIYTCVSGLEQIHHFLYDVSWTPHFVYRDFLFRFRLHCDNCNWICSSGPAICSLKIDNKSRKNVWMQKILLHPEHILEAFQLQKISSSMLVSWELCLILTKFSLKQEMYISLNFFRFEIICCYKITQKT